MTLHSARSSVRLVVAVCASLIVLALSRPASAYPWMIRHEYSACYACHADPSGSGLLTAFGRTAGETWLTTQWHRRPEPPPEAQEPAGDEDEEATDAQPGKAGAATAKPASKPPAAYGRGSKFLWGVLPLPDNVLLGGDFRGGLVKMSSVNGGPSTSGFQFYMMQADLEGQVSYDRLRVNGSLGIDATGQAKTANLTSGGNDNLVSRLHWVGADLGANREWLVRFGHMNVPYGLRSIEHELWARSTTQTDINQDQEDGLAVSYNGHGIRGEVMGVLGNLQVSPSQFRERGYIGYVEYAPAHRVAVGVDSLILHADDDLNFNQAAWRQSHGAFARWAPIEQLYFSGEASFVYDSTPKASTGGYVGTFQVDYEPITGVHVEGTAEASNMPGGPATVTLDKPAFDYWGTVCWFFNHHADLRLDVAYQSYPPPGAGQPGSGTTVLVGQLHLYL